MRRFGQSSAGKSLAAASAVALALAPALATAQSKSARAPAVSFSFDPVAAFTPANADPRLAAAFANRAPMIADFKFTPAAAKSRPSQVRVAIRASADSPASVRVADVSRSGASSIGALTPTSYRLGVAVGWRSFAVAGDVAKASAPNPALEGRESAMVGVSYSLKRFTGRVAVGAERGDSRGVPALREGESYSVDLGGAYNITRNIAVTGGVRYRVDTDRLAPLDDDRRDSQAVYVGTAFKF